MQLNLKKTLLVMAASLVIAGAAKSGKRMLR